MMRQFRSNPFYGKNTAFVLHHASPQKRARRRIIRSIGVRQFKKQQRAFVAREMAGAL